MRVRRKLIVVDDIAGVAKELFLLQRPRTVALSGGVTPCALYEELARSVHPWPETDIFFGDERCVPPTHPDSNYGMVERVLLSKISAKVHRMRGESCGVEEYESQLATVFGTSLPRFDLVLLGLGQDGHTASLFPGDSALGESSRRVAVVYRPDHSRLTLTLPVLSAARMAMFLVAGANKARALKWLLDGEDIPAARVEAQEVVIVADKSAAGKAEPSC